MADVGDLALPALAALCAIVLFISILALQGKKKMSRRVAALGDHGERNIQATVYVEENGQTVRRSTRAHKTPTGAAAKTPAASPKPKSSSRSKTPTRSRSKTPSKTRAEPAAAAKTPETKTASRSETASPPRTRSRKTPKPKA